MTTPPPADAETMLRLQQFAENALDELARRAEAGGIDPVQLHIAICIATMGYLANKFGPRRAAELIDQLSDLIRNRPAN
jgi:CO/xanthine dehydrogenase Mo-binding subunit